MATKPVKNVSRKPKSLAHVLRLFSGLLPRVDPITGVYYPGQKCIQVEAAELSPILRRRFRESGVILVEDNSETTAILRLAAPSDARQLDLFSKEVGRKDPTSEEAHEKQIAELMAKWRESKKTSNPGIWPPATFPGTGTPVRHPGAAFEASKDKIGYVTEVTEPNVKQPLCAPSVFGGVPVTEEEARALDESLRVVGLQGLVDSPSPTPGGGQTSGPVGDP